MTNDTRRMAAHMYFKEELGYTSAAAARASMAMMPLDDAYKPGRAFRKGARKLASNFAKQSKNYDLEGTDLLAKATLEALRELATEHGEDYYTARYDTALNS